MALVSISTTTLLMTDASHSRTRCETELADIFPEHVVGKWIGNARVVARRQCLQVTDVILPKLRK